MSSTAFIEPLPVIDFVAQLLNRDISVRPLSDSDRVKVWTLDHYLTVFDNKFCLCLVGAKSLSFFSL